MTLDCIALKDFGVYGGRQEAALTPADESRPIVLFGGLNGGGKTTLLDAVQLALYGPRARCSGRGRLGYRDYLRDMIHRGADPAEGAAIELRFRRVIDGENHNYRILRSWRVDPKGIEERVEVFDDAACNSLLSEHWDEFIESYFPNGIAHLFFFDAEQIKELAEGDRAAEILGTAVHTLLGLDLVDHLDTDLIALARRKRSGAKCREEEEMSRAAHEELCRYQCLLDEAKQQQGTLGNELARLRKELAEYEERFRRAGGEIYLLRAALESEWKQFQQQLRTEEAALRELAAGPAPLLLIPSLLEEAEIQARREVEAHNSEVLMDALEKRDADLLAHLQERNIPSGHLDLVSRFLEADRTRREGAKAEATILHADDHFATALRHLRTTILPEIKTRIQAKLENVGKLQERVMRLDLELARVPTEDSLGSVHQELIQAKQKHDQKQAELAAHEDKVRLLRRQWEAAKRTFERQLGCEVEVQIDRGDHARIIKHASRVRETLAKFRVAVIRKHAGRLERLVLESFIHLLRKRGLVEGLKIDPETFHVELTGGDGKPLPFDRLSAGERQLLATSLLWGLAKASGRSLPMIVDTPLGRLDSSHRSRLLDRYFPVASHQVILLSTDEEVDEASIDRLEPYIGRSYTLAFDDERRATKIIPGYFWKCETAS